MRQADGFSIRRRVFVLALVSLACASVALYFFLQSYAQRASEQAFDRLLAASALTIAGSVQIEDAGVTAEPPFSSLAMLPGNERVFYQVLNSSGRAITGYDDLAPGLPLADLATPLFTYGVYYDDAIRVATVGRLVSASQHAGWVTVRVAAQDRVRERGVSAEVARRGSRRDQVARAGRAGCPCQRAMCGSSRATRKADSPVTQAIPCRFSKAWIAISSVPRRPDGP